MRYSNLTDILGSWPGAHALGHKSILRGDLLGVIWSHCYASDFSEGLAAVEELRDADIAAAIGYGSSMESMSVELLLEGRQPVVVCFFKALACYGIPPHWTKAIDNGRMLLVASCSPSVRRKTRSRVKRRDELISAVASAVFMPYASRDGDDEAIAREIAASRKPFFTLKKERDPTLLNLGAKRFSISGIRRVMEGSRSK